MVEGSAAVDWGMAEALAFGSLLIEGTPIRLSGQDTVRGTFSHRHAAFTDTQTGHEWAPLTQLADGARYEIYDSPLSEAGALGFEYGYSVAGDSALFLLGDQFCGFPPPGLAGQCSVHTFAPADCTLNGSGATLKCKQP